MRITDAQAEQILTNDLQPIEHDVNTLVTVPITQAQFDALVSFHFNTGWLTHQHCSLLQSLNNKQYILAANDFCLYDRAGGQIIKGLDNRRAAEKALFNSETQVAMAPAQTAQTFTQTLEQILQLITELTPLLGAIPQLKPALPIIRIVLPIALQAVETVANETHTTPAVAAQQVAQHLTPQLPNVPALSPTGTPQS
jgi:hypothetical protein